MTHLAFELRTSIPDPVLASVAARVEAGGYRSVWVNHPPGEDGIVMAGVGALQIAELEGSASFLSWLPAYAAHFRRTGVRPEQTWIAAGQLSELPRLLEPWRDTVDEVVLVPVSADEAESAGALADAAIAAFQGS